MKQFKVLELFAGSRSFSKVAEKYGCQTHTSDIEPYDGIDQVCDIFDFDYKKVGFIPDIIWCSPPCTCFSISSCSTHWDKSGEPRMYNPSDKDREYIPKTENAEWALRIVRKMKEIISVCTDLNPHVIFIIENPRGMLRKMPEMKIYNLVLKTVWYCQYGDTRAKPTDIWTNAPWIPRAVCKNGNPDCHHERAPRGSKTGTQGLKNAHERSKIPEQLCEEILRSIIDGSSE
tara:strand:- start:415 stop:1107 length:693 start_codon:yes stop_codon:yes gene_type:complete